MELYIDAGNTDPSNFTDTLGHTWLPDQNYTGPRSRIYGPHLLFTRTLPFSGVMLREKHHQWAVLVVKGLIRGLHVVANDPIKEMINHPLS